MLLFKILSVYLSKRLIEKDEKPAMSLESHCVELNSVAVSTTLSSSKL